MAVDVACSKDEVDSFEKLREASRMFEGSHLGVSNLELRMHLLEVLRDLGDFEDQEEVAVYQVFEWLLVLRFHPQPACILNVSNRRGTDTNSLVIDSGLVG